MLTFTSIFSSSFFHNTDSNRDGKIDLREFYVLHADVIRRTSLIAQAREKFDELDVGRKGTLEHMEINEGKLFGSSMSFSVILLCLGLKSFIMFVFMYLY